MLNCPPPGLSTVTAFSSSAPYRYHWNISILNQIVKILSFSPQVFFSKSRKGVKPLGKKVNIQPQNAPNNIQPNFTPYGGLPDSGSGPLDSQNLAPTNPETASDPYNGAGSVIYGNVSLDLYFSRAEYQRTDITKQGPNGVQTLRQELYRKFEAGISLDFSFMAKFDGAAEKMAQLDPSVFDKWMATASDLMDLKQSDFEEFVKATDELFNEIEKVLGMGPNGLDNIASFFSSQVGGFLDNVKEKVDYFNNNPLGQGEDLGLGIPGLLEDAKNSIPENLKQFFDELLAKLTKDLNGDPEMAGLKQLIDNFRKLQADFFQQLQIGGEKDTEDQQAPDTEETETAPKGEGTIQPFNQYQMQQVYYMEQVSSFTASYSLTQQTAGQPDGQSGEKPLIPLDTTA
ncbi:hypothetical protein MNBD_NITROSPINAE04-383 [hydrothermal vent metagenome]|uniref:Uncharacterized protein n=1 Tax=hydrothermal vent metagenome TaxID=652676 RepID=A0A3B1C4L8_9ZZZZ